MATIKEIMTYFGFSKSSEFSEEWKRLSDEEKEFFKRELGKLLGKDCGNWNNAFVN